MYGSLKAKALKANLELKKHDLVIFTWGNASVWEGGTVAIKPSGISYDVMRKKDIVVVDFDGYIIDGKLKPSVDLPTHLELYRNYPEMEASSIPIPLCHRLGPKRRSVPVYGTTHADYFGRNSLREAALG